MNRRTFLKTTAAALAAASVAFPAATPTGRFAGKIRKSLKWGMA